MSTETTTLNVAIVGCGIIGLNHARAILRHPALRLSALVDAVPAAATALADQLVSDFGADRVAEFTSLSAALAGAPIDIVVICTPSGLHVVLAEEALAAGKHVVIEKPLDVSLPRAREILALSRRAEQDGLVVSVISQHRFDPASLVVAGAAHSGAFGRLTSGLASVAWWRSQEYYDSGQWRGTWELDGGGAVMNQGVHTVDLLVWFLGQPVEIDARTALLAHERVEVEDIAVATIRFESGALAVLHATTAAYPGLSVRLQVHGDRGSAIIDDDQLEYFGTADTDGNRAADLVPASDLRGGDRGPDQFVIGHFRQYDDIVEAIREHRAPGVTVADAFLSLAVVRAVYLSATLGRPVLLDDVLDGSLDDVEVTTGVRA
ncbi:UDP-N-acetyl-2-amino-2-deoxyglucuronate dehydrogenase [Leifsonia sp. EB41]|uniref:Gfo/Idh/MocA family protein n=1 Tax=Leifsonia sp. EB41 TaxID=3156260 RepID=UPI00351647A4